MNGNSLAITTASNRPQFVDTSIPDLSEATIGALTTALNITADSQLTISSPAGPNRRFNLRPAVALATSLTKEVKGLRTRIDLAIDTEELDTGLMTKNYPQNFPEIKQLEIYLPNITDGSLSIVARVQERSNSVIETVQAMQAAAHSGTSHFIAPRHSQALAKRVTDGLKHYCKHLAVDQPMSISAPRHRISFDDKPSVSQTALEISSGLFASLTKLFGSRLYENMLERKGIFGKLANTAQNAKLRSF